MKTNPIQTSFNSGETSPELDGRIDLEKYASSCSRLENFYPLIQGPARRRPGTKFINGTKTRNSNEHVWLQRFVFNRDNAYIMEIGQSYTRFHTASGTIVEAAKTITGITQANPAVVTSNAHGYANGEWTYIESVVGMTQVNGKYFEIANVTANTFSLKDSLTGTNINSTSYTAYSSGGTSKRVHEIATGSGVNDDGTIQATFAQNGDVLYKTDKSEVTIPRKITRTASNAFTVSNVDPVDGPFEDVDPDNTITVYSDARTGAVTLTASSPIFDITTQGSVFYLEQKSIDDVKMWEPAKAVLANDIRRSDGKNYKAVANGTTGTIKPTHSTGTKYDGDAGVQWEFRDPGYGIVRIDTASGTTASCTVLKPIPDGAVLVGQASTRWAKSDWYKNGFPSHVTFFRDRLVFARASDQKIWFSVAADYESFADRDDGGIVTSDMAASIQLTSDQPSEIKWMSPADNLIIGTVGPEFVVGEITRQDVFGPGNIKASPQTYFGSMSAAPAKIGSTTFFVQSSGRKIRELSYSLDVDGLASIDITRLSPRMIPKSATAIQLAYQQEPHSIIWIVRDDGGLIGFTYNREENVFGWHRHTLGGSGVFVESVECIPESGGNRDEVWLCSKRTINGTTRHYIEVMQDEWDSSLDIEDAWFVDCGLKYDGSPATTISGLDHLEGQSLSILADGSAHPSRTVSGGAIALQVSASVVIAGLSQTATLATKRIEAGTQAGTAQTRIKKISKVWVRFLDTVGGKAGPTQTNLQTILFRRASDPMGGAIEAFTGDKEIDWRGGYERDGIIWYVNDQPLPCTIVALVPEMETNE